METSQPQNQSNENNISLRTLWLIAISNWYWFALSVFITLTCAYIYITITEPIYNCNAAIVIQDNDNGKSLLTSGSEFADMGLFSSKSNIQNEVIILKAPELMESVVKQLNLNTTYCTQRNFQTQLLYKTSPISVWVERDSLLNSVSINIRPLSLNRVEIGKIAIDGETIDSQDVIGRMGEPIETAVGNIIITPTKYYTNELCKEKKDITYSKCPTQQVAALFCTKLNVILTDKKSSVINISITDISRKRAEDILTSIIDNYNRNWIVNKNTIARATSQFINERLQIIERELSSVDNDISSFKSRNLLPDAASVSTQYLEVANENEKELTHLHTQRSMAEYVNKYLKQDVDMNNLLPANSGIDNINIETQINRYNELVLTRNNLQSNSSANNPFIKELNKSIAALRQSIIKSIDDLVAMLNIQIKTSRDTGLSTKQKLASNPQQAKYLLSVERQQKVKEALYVYLLQKREENEISQAFAAYNTTIVNNPRSSKNPIAPKTNLVFMFALLLGLMIPAAILYLIEYLDVYVRSRKDIETLIVPFLGEIPLQEKKNAVQTSAHIVIDTTSRNLINEAFRILRTNIDFMYNTEKNGVGKVIMTTSIYPGSGKTFISMNIATTITLTGAKVLIIDSDIRQATISHSTKCAKEGLSSYLSGNCDDIFSLIVKEEYGQDNIELSILPVGAIPPNPSELLLKPRYAEMLDILRKEYDYIFIDCPPIGIITDASIIAKHCDIALFIIRAGHLELQRLPEINQMYTSKELPNMGVILNGTTVSSHKYGYRKYGYGTYGYYNYKSYGESHNDKN